MSGDLIGFELRRDTVQLELMERATSKHQKGYYGRKQTLAKLSNAKPLTATELNNLLCCVNVMSARVETD